MQVVFNCSPIFLIEESLIFPGMTRHSVWPRSQLRLKRTLPFSHKIPSDLVHFPLSFQDVPPRRHSQRNGRGPAERQQAEAGRECVPNRAKERRPRKHLNALELRHESQKHRHLVKVALQNWAGQVQDQEQKT